ncbi:MULTISPECIES: META domain-containing protein [Flavobacterium]|uniref:META domain-containing protein n=2 Tax=Flavobacterium TaxID=237 RepID=A0AA94EZ17_9FLAO|nr:MULTISPECIES: META domain-containing protein [Flavobacterium]OXA79477.1 hypothetical protein B0A56_07590 [Flavobacterium columnare NBRC 100251 = ATCC 23463]AMA49123.1 hypothetical protein AWN65_06445 [Flavobacterium covae]AND64806.1 hypothetical protein AX766_10585 [Flavobacterium covae]MCH4831055.1 META domain-containing protein [Flavobacterium columnare]MCH4833003.1 META domain-containing protein [Flavobacterium columnare]
MIFKELIKKSIILTFIVFFFSCYSKVINEKERHLNRKWMLVEMDSIPSEILIKNNAYIDMTIKKGEASAYLGCNKFSFSYRLKNSNTFSTTNIISTKMFCKETIEIEEIFIKLISKVNSFNTTKAHQLELFINGEKKMRFVAADWD